MGHLFGALPFFGADIPGDLLPSPEWAQQGTPQQSNRLPGEFFPLNT